MACGGVDGVDGRAGGGAFAGWVWAENAAKGSLLQGEEHDAGPLVSLV